MAISKLTLKVLNKLFDAGYMTEKEMTAITLKDLTVIDGITVPEMVEVTKLQDAIKANRMISYLSGITEQKKIENLREQPYSGNRSDLRNEV